MSTMYLTPPLWVSWLRMADPNFQWSAKLSRSAWRTRQTSRTRAPFLKTASLTETFLSSTMVTAGPVRLIIGQLIAAFYIQIDRSFSIKTWMLYDRFALLFYLVGFLYWHQDGVQGNLINNSQVISVFVWPPLYRVESSRHMCALLSDIKFHEIQNSSTANIYSAA